MTPVDMEFWWSWGESNPRPQSRHLKIYMFIWSIDLTQMLPDQQGSHQASLLSLVTATQTRSIHDPL